jgi:hypothetical protein
MVDAEQLRRLSGSHDPAPWVAHGTGCRCRDCTLPAAVVAEAVAEWQRAVKWRRDWLYKPLWPLRRREAWTIGGKLARGGG